ncbi:hypothetical protein ACFT1A_02205 [Rhodococcus sp. NPDC057135]|uniref:hypothetical protein n=1 Tax=Rhodococcus sp. NPDC057135 TaxID=3346028 RepID=UPI003643D482
MRKSGIGFAIAAVVASAGLIGSGVAQAGPAPTGNYQMCGYTYQGAIVDNVDPPATVTKLSGKVVTGKLKLGGSTVATYTATSDANGGYCFQGNAGMVGTVALGGVVEISSPGGTVFHNPVTQSDFATHAVGTTSATNFHVAF